jgi:hypothetical protein
MLGKRAAARPCGDVRGPRTFGTAGPLRVELLRSAPEPVDDPPHKDVHGLGGIARLFGT